MTWLGEAAIYLGAAALSVPVARKLGLGSVLGYVFAGIVIGPWVLGLISSPESVLHASEIGVVLLLFIIGLELQPARLWVLRRSILGMGSVQVAVTLLLLGAAALVVVGDWRQGLVIGFGLSLSSTAFALQLLAERKALLTPHGRAGFGILLFQDLAVIPFLVLLPVLAGNGGADAGGAGARLLQAIIVVAAYVLVMRFGLRPLLRIMAATGLHELFTIVALLLVLGSALVMDAAGLSMGLGAFLAGVLVADSEYRHQLESDIEPFKGLLLALFFMAVGMSANLGVLMDRPLPVLGGALGLVLVKAVVLAGMGRLFGLGRDDSLSLAAYLAQGGEFGFIVFTLAAGSMLRGPDTVDMLILMVTLSMIMTPFLVIAADALVRRFAAAAPTRPYDELDGARRQVIVAGFGRFGQIISRILASQHIPFTAIEIDPGHVDFVRRFGNKVYYGDAGNVKLLRAAGIEECTVLVLAIGKVEKSVAIADMIRREFPRVKLFARARNRMHEIRLRALGVDGIIRDTLLSSVELAGQVLGALGFPADRVGTAKQVFLDSDRRTLDRQYAFREDEQMLIQTSREAAAELESLFAADENARQDAARTDPQAPVHERNSPDE